MVNRAQRCEYYKLAVFLVGGGGKCGPVCRAHACGHFGSSMSLRAILKEFDGYDVPNPATPA